ncbi:MAG: NAD(P)-dependent oxidoreductase [Candidatus Melainabacteria bacterium]|nr:MAG: NAD(P)-dependent oxidoreductase [Candidatus Melainabacteria bacterium]
MSSEKDVYLITGSSGLLGHALSHHFGSRDNLVVGFDQSGPPYPTPNTECLFCDLTSDESVQKTMFMVRSLYGNKIKSVFHLAAYYSFSGKDSHLYKDLTVDGTKRLLRELQKFEVEQFIFSSSMLVYRPNRKGEKLTESSPLEPTWAYPESKVETERVLQENRGSIPIVNLRIAGVYSDVCQSIPLAHQIQRIYEHRLEGHLYSGDVDVRQSFVHMEDLVLAFEACVKNRNMMSNFETINIGEEDALSYDETQRIIARQLFDEPWPTLDVPKPIAKVGAWVEDKMPVSDKPFIKPWMIDRADDNYELNGEKARQLIGWSPSRTLRDTLPKILEGLKVDPEKWYRINKLHWHGDEAPHTVDPIKQIEHQTQSSELLDPPGPAPAALIPPRHDIDEQRSREAS